MGWENDGMRMTKEFFKDLYWEMLALQAKPKIYRKLLRMEYPLSVIQYWAERGCPITTWHYVDVEKFEDFFKKYINC